MYLAFIQLELFLMQKYTLTNLLSYCKGARLSTDLTCNLAYWHHLIVSMEIDKSYATLWNIPDRESVRCCCAPGT